MLHHLSTPLGASLAVAFLTALLVALYARYFDDLVTPDGKAAAAPSPTRTFATTLLAGLAAAGLVYAATGGGRGPPSPARSASVADDVFDARVTY